MTSRSQRASAIGLLVFLALCYGRFHLGSILGPILPADTVLCPDGGTALAAAARHLEVEHHPINLSVGVRVQGAWHVQNVNAFVSRLRTWRVRFKGVATKYLTHYLG